MQTSERMAGNDAQLALLRREREAEEESIKECEAKQARNDRELAELDKLLGAASASRHSSDKEKREAEAVEELKRYHPGTVCRSSGDDA